MHLDATPPLDDRERRALAAALELASRGAEDRDPYAQPWRAAGLREAAEGDEADVRYAFSPRSTRGATRA